MATRSRLSRKLERQTRNTFLLSVFGIAAILVILVKFGIPFLTNFSLFISGSNSANEQTDNKDKKVFIQSPILDPMKSATNSAKIIIKGVASSNQTIDLYINEDIVDKTKTKKDNVFIFEDVTLATGENVIKVQATTKEGKKSEFSNPITVIYKKESPTLTVDTPKQDESFSKDSNPISVSGKTSIGSRVTVNDFWAIVDDEGNFSYNLRLKNGDNTIKIIATDEAGNKTEAERKVKYSE